MKSQDGMVSGTIFSKDAVSKTREAPYAKIDRIHPNILRHTFTTKFLMNGGDVFSLQQILGHTSLEMVRKYSHLASAYMLNTHKKCSPLDNIYIKKQGAI